MSKIYRLNSGIEFRTGVKEWLPFIIAGLVLILGIVFLNQIVEFMIALSFHINF